MTPDSDDRAERAPALIFVVEDDADIAALLAHTILTAGYASRIFLDGEKVVECAREQAPALILLDLMLPGQDGIEILRCLELQQQTREIRKIVLSARGSEVDKVRALELGADDYVTKPFSPRELVLRIRAVLRSLPGDSGRHRTARAGELAADLDARSVTVGGRPIHLTTTEYEVLVQLMLHAGLTLSRERLLANIRPSIEHHADSRMVDVYVRRLREKIETDPSHPRILVTRRGGGYALIGPVQGAVTDGTQGGGALGEDTP